MYNNQRYSTGAMLMPKWIANKALLSYFLLMIVVAIIFNNFIMDWYWLVIGVVEITMFWYIGQRASKGWSVSCSSKQFEKKIFFCAFCIRFIYMVIMYIAFMENYGDAFGFDAADSTYYHKVAVELAANYRIGNFNIPQIIDNYVSDADFSDLGQATYLSFIYFLTDDSIFTSRVVKCLLNSWVCVMLYRLAKRNFGEGIGRLTAVMAVFYSNFWYYCGVHLKETEMVFLSVLFVEQTDLMIRSNKFTATKIIPVLLIAGVLFAFRTPLALVCVLSLLFSITMTSSKIIGWGKRILIGLLALLLVGATMGNRIYEETQSLVQRATSNEQQSNMEWRMRRGAGHGNQFAKYAGAAVFAPMIFTLPFTTMVNTPDQEIQRIHHVGNYTKNILSGFVIFAMVMLLISGDWRKHLVPLSFMLGYLIVLALSTFAQAERFHQPVQPFELMFAAYGISLCGKRERKWFNWWMIFMFAVILFWQWFKLKGKGLI